MKTLLINFIFISFLCSCASSRNSETQRSFDLMSLAYHQLAAETTALQLQAYNVAIDRLTSAIKKKSIKPKAVILDIDETVLNNAPYQLRANRVGNQYPEGWQEWTSAAKAEVLPGAKAFIDFALKKKVAVYLITNRYENERQATLDNLESKGINVKGDHLILRKDISSKEARRQMVSEKYDVVLLVGDNLADFDKLYDKKTLLDRKEATEKLSAEFGRRYIVLPNPMYGDWEGAVFQGKYPKDNVEKDLRLKQIILENSSSF